MAVLDAIRHPRSHDRLTQRVRLAAATVVVVVFFVWVWVEFVPLGFNPTDDGYIVSQARRVVTGNVPHADLLSPRPLGSAFVHVIDLAVPLPLFEATRMLFVVEVTAMSAFFLWFALSAPPSRWAGLHVAALAASVLVNLHSFPFLPWHTTDGLTALAAGLVAVHTGIARSSRWQLALGFLLLGAAPLMKQSFVFAPLLGAVWLAAAYRTIWRERRARLDVLASIAAAGLPGVVYVSWVAAAGGVSSMVGQLAGSARLGNYPIVDQFRSEPGRTQLVQMLVQLAVALLAARLLDVVGERVGVIGPLALLPRAVAAVVVFRVVVSEDLTYASLWGAKLTWALAIIVVAELALWRRPDPRGLVVFAAGLMASLSWGYAYPNLVAGTTAVTSVHRLFVTAPRGRFRAWMHMAPALAGAALAVAVLAATFADARRTVVYNDHPAPELTAKLGPVDGDFGRLRSTPTVRRYLDDLVACLREHPAGRVAVLPDNPGVYPALDLDNPFPIDWVHPPEFVDAEQQLIDAAHDVARDGDYLVLFQTFAAWELTNNIGYPDAGPDSTPFTDGDPTLTRMAEIVSASPAQRVHCGAFIGFYLPPGPPSSVDGGRTDGDVDVDSRSSADK